MGRPKKTVVEAHEVRESNVFENPEEATIDGSETNLAVLSGNQIEAPDEDLPEETEETRVLRVRVKELIKTVDNAYWELAEKLADVSNKKLYKAWGFNTFEAYLGDDCGYEKRKGYYFVQIHNYFNNELKTKISEDLYNRVIGIAKRIGWTKAMKLATEQVLTEENADEIMNKALTCSVKDLEALCKIEFDRLSPEDQEQIEDENNLKRVKMTVQLTLSQKKDVDEALEKALSMMKDGASDSNALSMICRDFLTTNLAASGKEESLSENLSKFERLLGVSLVAFDDTSKSVVYGKDTLQKLAEDHDEEVDVDVDVDEEEKFAEHSANE